jgi:hypothetical protein
MFETQSLAGFADGIKRQLFIAQNRAANFGQRLVGKPA